MTRSALTLSTILLLAAVAHADVAVPGATPPSAPGPQLVASLQRGACFGRCPIYKVSVMSDGRVEWQGNRFVKVTGNASGKVDAARLQELRAAFKAIRFLDLTGDFECRELTDHPSATIFFSDGTRSRQLRHYHGCKSTAGVQELSRLEERIDALLGTAQWVGGR